MDSSNHAFSNCTPLKRVVKSALRELERLGYSRRSLRRYRTIWRHLLAFAQDNGFEDRYSEELAQRFIDASPCCNGESVDPSKGWRRHAAFGVKVLGDFNRDGCIERSRTDMQKLAIPPAMKKPLRDFEAYCRDRRHLRLSSLAVRIGGVAKLLAFLGSRDVLKLQHVQAADLTAFVASLHRFRPRTVSSIVSDVRQFLRFLTMRGILSQDLSHVLPTIRASYDTIIPSVWDPQLVVKLLGIVDRSSPKGKRDYAMLLLASRLGLRVGDLRRLKLDDLDWEASTVTVAQAKTGAALTLPVSEEVGEALIDYLRFGRPAVEHREVFLKLKPPLGPFSYNNHLYHVVGHWRRAAGIEFRTQQRQGFHSLRHTLATHLLREQTPINVISDILGHATSASTFIYAKADTETLRGAALDTEGMHHDE